MENFGMEDFGKPFYFSSKRINDDTQDIINYLIEFANIIKKEPFTAMEFMQFIHEENPVQVNITKQKIRSLFHNMCKRKGLKKTVKNATPSNHQKYVLITNQFIIQNKKTPLAPLDKKYLEPSENEKPVEKGMLTLKDAQRMKEMDVAFIGYSIVKEIEASLGMIQVLEDEVKHLRDESTKEEIFRLKMADMEEKHNRETNILKEKISQLSKDIQKLNNQIVAKNTLIERYESSQGSSQTTFKMGELARLKNDRPSHLNRG